MADHRGGDYDDADDEGGTTFHFRGDGRPSRRVRGRPGWAAAAAAAALALGGGGGGGGGDGDGDGNGDGNGNGNHSSRVREAGGIGGQGDSGGVGIGVGTLALPGLLGLRGLTRIWGRSPPPNLTDHILREDWALAAMECRMRPRSAAQWTTQGGFYMGRHSASVLPLHQAAALRPPPHLLQTLVLAHPEAIRQAERGGGFGRLPLHIAARSRAGRDAIECLLTYHPQAAGTPDQLRRLPLHYALKNGSDPGVVGLLLEASPGAVRAADHRGWLPLHVACSAGTPPEVMGWLLEDHPELVLERTGRGSDCLKCARMSRGHPNEEEVVRFLQGRMDALAGGGGGGDHAEEEEEEKEEKEEEEKEEDLIGLADLAAAVDRPSPPRP